MSDAPRYRSACRLGHEAHHVGPFSNRAGTGSHHPRMGKDDLDHWELCLGMIGFFRTLDEHAQTPQSAKIHHAAIHFGESLVRGEL